MDPLKRAVLEYLDQYFVDDETGERPGWPNELEQMTGWTEPLQNRETGEYEPTWEPEPTLGWIHECSGVGREVWTIQGAACVFCSTRMREGTEG